MSQIWSQDSVWRLVMPGRAYDCKYPEHLGTGAAVRTLPSHAHSLVVWMLRVPHFHNSESPKDADKEEGTPDQQLTGFCHYTPRDSETEF